MGTVRALSRLYRFAFYETVLKEEGHVRRRRNGSGTEEEIQTRGDEVDGEGETCREVGRKFAGERVAEGLVGGENKQAGRFLLEVVFDRSLVKNRLDGGEGRYEFPGAKAEGEEKKEDAGIRILHAARIK